MINQSPRAFAPDFIRALAIVGVLAIHLTYPIYARPDFLGGATWWVAQVINAIFRISIPLFVMLSGYLLLNKSESISQTLKRTVRRLGVPLLAWSIFYLIWNNYWFKAGLEIQDLMNSFLAGGFGHLYFFFILINLYILLPILRPFWQKATKSAQIYSTTLSLLFGLIYTGLLYFFLEQNEVGMFVITGLPYLGYFLAGAFLGNLTLNRLQIKLFGLLWFVTIMATAILGFLNLKWFTQGNLIFWGAVPYFDSYLSLNVMLASLLAFTFLIHFNYKKITDSFLSKPIKLLADISLGLYVLHPFVMNILDRTLNFQVDFMSESLWMYLVKRTILVFIFGIIISWVGQKIPIVKKTFGK